MNNLYFNIRSPINIVALTDAPRLLKLLEVGTGYVLTPEQHKQALTTIERVQSDSQAVLQDIVAAFLREPILDEFALIIQQVFMPN